MKYSEILYLKWDPLTETLSLLQNYSGQLSGNNSRFRGYQQQDAHDLLMMLLENLDKEAIKKKEKPISEHVFGGKMLTSSKSFILSLIVLCLTCNQESRVISPYNNLMLEILFKESNTKNLKEKYLKENKVMSVRGGKEYKISSEAKALMKKEKSKKIGFFKSLFWCCTRKNSNEKDVQPQKRKVTKKKNKSKILLKTANGNIIIDEYLEYYEKKSREETEKDIEAENLEENINENEEDSEHKEEGSTKPSTVKNCMKDTPDLENGNAKPPLSNIQADMDEFKKLENPLEFRYRKIKNLNQISNKDDSKKKRNEEEKEESYNRNSGYKSRRGRSSESRNSHYKHSRSSENNEDEDEGEEEMENGGVSMSHSGPSKPKVRFIDIL